MITARIFVSRCVHMMTMFTVTWKGPIKASIMGA